WSVLPVAITARPYESPDAAYSLLVRNRLESRSGRLGAGPHRDYAGHRHSRSDVDRADPGVRMRGTHHRRMGLMFEIDVVAEATVAHDEAHVLLAADGLADSGGGRGLRHYLLAHRYGR